ncbi:MAG: DHH family phosphoesterase [Candidatus Parvarchaeota archaeon]|nr:DHH family phosphoesterase [Candidatus Jingweiarchaeum tengchongense]MCW1297838.1 DHH family phosphoesterase [Candidatus Jingweiarchaeum tengchongense]MCW1299849.1 DHH family phosphoesterase [Candidatus Jingweiarchaeum tengchongense]MCW1304181.1 DHH family phosphoesterase [Candidatus Jingweiarchaeum tengchongense]MCW1305209.1 DHH family phosphoesterase [Candidatus Jingweiarchaeum tengchongense]
MLDLFEKIKRELEGKEIVVFYHIDTDGICSAKILNVAIKSLGGSVKKFLPCSPEKLSKRLKMEKSNILFVVDLPFDKLENESKTTSKKIVIFDHHPRSNVIDNDNIILVEPSDIDLDEYCPASRLVYEFFSKFINMEIVDWIACTGTIGDGGAKYWRDFIEKTLKKYNYTTGKDENFNDTFFGNIDKIIGSGRIYRGETGASEILDVLLKSETIGEFLSKSKKFIEWKERIEKNLKEMILKFDVRKEEYKEIELCFFEIENPKYNIGSALASMLSYKFPNLTIVLIVEKRNFATVNLRRYDGKIDLNVLVREAIRNIPKASGGGHKQASGATMLKGDVKKFKQRIIELLKNFYLEESANKQNQ